LGGPGSGRWSAQIRRTVEEAAKFALVGARRAGTLNTKHVTSALGTVSPPFRIKVEIDPLRPSTPRVHLVDATNPPEPTMSTQSIWIDMSHTPTGGIRLWLVCSCLQRSRTLYRPDEEKEFKCRQCYRLIYRSRSRRPIFSAADFPGFTDVERRALNRMVRVRERFGLLKLPYL
jgi:hypothetical protein